MNTSVYHEGYEDYKAGRGILNNPYYTKNDEDSWEWEDGWWEAYDENPEAHCSRTTN